MPRPQYCDNQRNWLYEEYTKGEILDTVNGSYPQQLPPCFPEFLAATAALEVQMSVCVSVCHTCYNCTKALNFKVIRLKDFCRTFEGLLKDF